MGIIGVANPLNKGICRNMLCPCGSGKKSKKCHGQNLVISKDEYDHIMSMGEKRETEFSEALLKAMDENGLSIRKADESKT
jgi:hypothetical protein